MLLLFFRFIFFLLITLVLLPFQVITKIFIKKYSYIIPFYFHSICRWVFGIKIKVFGIVSMNNPKLSVSNHASYLDIMILGSLFQTSFVAKKEVSSWPLIGILAYLQNTVFVDRKISSIKHQENKIINHLKEKKNLVIFPEGTSSDGNKVLPFKSSLFNIFTENKNSKIIIQTITIVYKKINNQLIDRSERQKVTWHSDMSLLSSVLNVLSKKSIEVEVFFDKEFIPNNLNRKKISLLCWKKINYNLNKSLLKK